jgi:HEAT repeat protein
MKFMLAMLTPVVIILAGCSGESGSTAGAAPDEQSAAIQERTFEPYNAEPESSAAAKPETAPEEEKSPYTGPAAPHVRKLGDDNSTIRDNAAEKLTDMGEAAVDNLIMALEDRDSNVRANAAWVLGRIKDKKAVEPLIKAARDRSAKVRSYAALALGKLGDEKAVPVLNAALNDTNRDVRLTARQALDKLLPKTASGPAAVPKSGGGGPEGVMRAFIRALAAKNPAAVYNCMSKGMRRKIEVQLAQVKSSSG